MALPRVKLNYGRTVNLGNYESLRLDLSVETDVKDLSMVETAYSELQQTLQEQMADAIKRELKWLGR
jgi:hypothetical protein